MEYFDEHNCQELADGQGPDHLMHFARLLIDTGMWNQVYGNLSNLIIENAKLKAEKHKIHYTNIYPIFDSLNKFTFFRTNFPLCLMKAIHHLPPQKNFLASLKTFNW